jgi:lipoprotein-anchoring transpeptidase ErfK/SrfK
MRCCDTRSLPLIGATAAALILLQSLPPAHATAAAPAPVVTPQEGSIAQPNPATPPADNSAVATQASPAPVEQAKPKPLPPSLVARINLTNQTMTVQAGGKTVHTWKVSTGAPGYATPPGKFKPGWMARIWHSRQYDDAPMPHSVFFNGGIAVHATTSLGNLGRAASHGCVRLAPANAEKFYNLVTRHGMARTQIIVHGAQPFSLAADRIGKINRQQAEAQRASRAATAGRTRNNRTGNEWVVVTLPRDFTTNRAATQRRPARVAEFGYAPSFAAVPASRRPAGRSATANSARY